MGIYEDCIEELSSLCGIIPEYYDIRGNLHRTTFETKRAVLSAMGIDVDSIGSLTEELRRRRLGPWLDIIEPVHVLSINEAPFRIPLYLPLEKGLEKGVSFEVIIKDEAGHKREINLPSCEGIVEERLIDGRRYVKVEICDDNEYDMGYYDIELCVNHYDRAINGLKKQTKLIISPDVAYLPDGLKKYLGLSVNLYSLKSRRNWGIGDFGDLELLLRWFGSLGGHLIGINPLHAISNTIPYGISPYSALSRLYKNYIYLDMERIGLKDKKRPNEIHDSSLIDYEGVAGNKLSRLKKAFDNFLKKDFKRGTELDKDFKTYLNEEGRGLELFATYMALSERFGSYDWQSWPVEYHDSNSSAVMFFMVKEKRGLLFHQFVQWLIDRQHRESSEVAKASGMPIGLYHDLAIGAIRDGSDVWCYKSLYALDMDVGAPPDDFCPEGQNWGLPPLIPQRLRESGYELYVDTLRKNMKYAGALRIDHALGIFRLFWIPKGMRPEMGTYVRYPYEEMLRIIALESVRNKTMVIAEDLGTIGENVRETLKRFRMLSYRLFYFERNYPEPTFLPPDKYPELALTAVNTHDLPTIYGFWTGRDIEERKRLNKFLDAEIWKRQIEERLRDKRLIIEALKGEGLIPEDYNLPVKMTEELCLAIYRYLLKTPSKIVLISLDDILGRSEQQNMPGVTEDYPNWRQRLEVDLEDIITEDSGPVKFIHSLINTLRNNGDDTIGSPTNSILN